MATWSLSHLFTHYTVGVLSVWLGTPAHLETQSVVVGHLIQPHPTSSDLIPSTFEQSRQLESHRRHNLTNMRLLDTKTLELVTFVGDETPLYAILSHRWEADEVSLQDMIAKTATEKAGYTKVREACSIAASHGLDYVWIDTCCIDKTSSAELSEAINTMYRWYQEAAVCYAFLCDVELNQSAGQGASFDARYPNFRETCWLTRGWTLQELIAPSLVIFLDSAWNEMGTKASLSGVLSDLTRIPEYVLEGKVSPQMTSSAQRFSWASRRETTRPEDIAYCLMGLFDVNMPILYGEGGERAFIRLQEQVIKVSDDHTIFAWEWRTSSLSRDPNGGLLASHPSAFDSCEDVVAWDSWDTRNTLSYVISTSNKGIHLNVNFIPGKDWADVHVAVLPCGRISNRDKWIGIPLATKSPKLECFTRVAFYPLLVLSFKDSLPGLKYPQRDICVQHGRQRDREAPVIAKAAGSGNVELVRMLLEKESGPKTYARTALLAAADAGRSSVVEFLISSGAYIETEDADGCNPLLAAAKTGNASVVASLIDRGAMVNATATTRDGMTALMVAAQEGHDSVIRILLSNGADLEAADHAHSTPLLCAIAMKQLEAARILALAGANVNVKNGHGSSALMCTAESGQFEMCQLLIDHGADIDARNDDGHSALEIALGLGHMDVAKIIRAASNKRSWWRVPFSATG